MYVNVLYEFSDEKLIPPEARSEVLKTVARITRDSADTGTGSKRRKFTGSARNKERFNNGSGNQLPTAGYDSSPVLGQQPQLLNPSPSLLLSGRGSFAFQQHPQLVLPNNWPQPETSPARVVGSIAGPDGTTSLLILSPGSEISRQQWQCASAPGENPLVGEPLVPGPPVGLAVCSLSSLPLRAATAGLQSPIRPSSSGAIASYLGTLHPVPLAQIFSTGIDLMGATTTDQQKRERRMDVVGRVFSTARLQKSILRQGNKVPCLMRQTIQ